jgi:uncharacterized protein YbjT (DUF2867 family)
MTPPVLVIGAAGRHGGTGTAVAEVLSKQGVSVRALTRAKGTRTAALEALGVDIVTGDLHDRRSLTAPLEGVEVVNFAYPVAAGIVDAAANFASAARSAGVKRVVVMSMAVSNPEGPSHLGRAQWLAEELLDWAGFSCMFLRFIAFFYENVPLLHRADALNEGVIRNSFADIPLPWIAGEDAGKLAAAAVLHPERFGPRSAIFPTGRYLYRYSEIAEILGKHLHRRIRHETISKEEWIERLDDLGATDNRVNNDMARHISALGAAFRGPIPPLNNIFEETTGEPALSLQQALDLGRISFREPNDARGDS